MILNQIDSLTKQASRIEEEIADLEEILSQRKADLSRILEEDIPSVLHEHGLLSADLADGRSVSIEQMISVSGIDKPKLFDWLLDYGYDAVIKTDISFGKGADTSEVEDYLQENGIDYEKDRNVHPMTLKKVIKDHLAQGLIAPPEEVAKISVFERAKIKGGK